MSLSLDNAEASLICWLHWPPYS